MPDRTLGEGEGDATCDLGQLKLSTIDSYCLPANPQVRMVLHPALVSHYMQQHPNHMPCCNVIGGHMELIQGAVKAQQELGNYAKLIMGTGREVHRRIVDMGKRRWDAWQAKKHAAKSKRIEFKPHLMGMPELDMTGGSTYLLGW